ncbi:hypothetical protein Q3G72_009110 [Acer saccharum]|nr:hypothetical protein Q3G72_009110 [Acer saccharum]
MVAVAWVNGNSGVGNVSLMDYILDIKEVVAKCKPRLSVTHVSRTTNVAADFLAKQGGSRSWVCVVLGGDVTEGAFARGRARFQQGEVCYTPNFGHDWQGEKGSAVDAQTGWGLKMADIYYVSLFCMITDGTYLRVQMLMPGL